MNEKINNYTNKTDEVQSSFLNNLTYWIFFTDYWRKPMFYISKDKLYWGSPINEMYDRHGQVDSVLLVPAFLLSTSRTSLWKVSFDKFNNRYSYYCVIFGNFIIWPKGGGKNLKTCCVEGKEKLQIHQRFQVGIPWKGSFLLNIEGF